jgi:hypothetical protein
MEAKEVPEKIYLNPLLMEDGESIVRRCTFERQRNSQIEYTRTDALVEKACEGVEYLLSGYIIRNFHFGDSYEIDTLIEDLKNYIKGE